MTRDQAIKILHNTKASKEKLREALASVLGIEYQATSKEGSESLFTQCKEVFMATYREHSKVDYSFAAQDGVALSKLIIKLKGLVHCPSDDVVVDALRVLLNKLPDWYRQNAYSLSVINSKFNEIIASITNGNQQRITDDYKARVLRDLTS